MNRKSTTHLQAHSHQLNLFLYCKFLFPMPSLLPLPCLQDDQISFQFHTDFIFLSGNFIIVFHLLPWATSFWYFILIFIPTITAFIVQLLIFHSNFHIYPHCFHCGFSLCSCWYFILNFILTPLLSLWFFIVQLLRFHSNFNIHLHFHCTPPIISFWLLYPSGWQGYFIRVARLFHYRFQGPGCTTKYGNLLKCDTLTLLLKLSHYHWVSTTLHPSG